MAVKRVGVLGAGQLGRMMALAGTPLDVEFCFYDGGKDTPCHRLGEVFDANEQDALQRFIDSVDVITYESENTDAEMVEQINKQKPVYPGVPSLKNSQHRLTEKTKFRELGIPTADFCAVRSFEDLEQAVATLGLPIVLKTTTMGYDGKGQALVKTEADIKPAWDKLGEFELIAEAFVNFSRELSIIAARDEKGNTVVYPLAENDHRDGILRLSTLPVKGVTEATQNTADKYITTLLNALGHVGVITLELFDTDNGLVANEMAPRVHNSGHWSIEGAESSQFENHVRAICGFPLGNTHLRHPYAAMINIIGKTGDREQVMAEPNAHLHLYGKSERAARKLGHINIVADTESELKEAINKFDAFLKEDG